MARLIAFYLPQFHPIPENDAWWGKGFTEWTNVTKARPWFKGHVQPHLPSDLGFYDLRVSEVREQQAQLASRFGIHGFCYYYYWFNGRRLLEKPLDAVLTSGQPKFPFCICWANESWSRRWDGSEQELLMEQVHTADSDKRFIEDILPILKDPRYIRINGAPLLLVYRFSLMADPVTATETWRTVARKNGIERLHICAVQSFGIQDPRVFGCDSAVEFPPHGVSAREITSEVEELDPKFEGKIYDYRDLIAADETRPRAPYSVFPAVMPSWDNTARRGGRGHVFHNSSPAAYEVWLRRALKRARDEPVEGEEIVFINAWNEWAEGTHLEPDSILGHANLEATRRALAESIGWRGTLAAVRARAMEKKLTIDKLLDDLGSHFEALEAANSYLKRQIEPSTLRKQLEAVPLADGLPHNLLDAKRIQPGLLNLEQVNHAQPGAVVRCALGGNAFLKGWAFTPDLPPRGQSREVHVVLMGIEDSSLYSAVVSDWDTRRDVSQAFPQFHETLTVDSGFSVVLDLSSVSPGHYQLAFVERGDGASGVAFAQPVFEIRG